MMPFGLNKKFPKYLIDQVRYSSPAMYTIARMMSAPESITPEFRDVLGVDSAIKDRFKNGEYDELFLSSAENGDIETLNYLLENGINKDVKNKHGETALHLAAGNGRINIMKQLIKFGSNKYVRDNDGWTPLKLAVYTGQTWSVKFLLNARRVCACIAGPMSWGYTLLHMASRYGYTEIAMLLIKAGFDVNARDFSGETPVNYATRNGYPGTAKALMNAGANSEIGWRIVKTAEMYQRRKKWPRNYRNSTYNFSLSNRFITDRFITMPFSNHLPFIFNSYTVPYYKHKNVKKTQRLQKKNKSPRRQKFNHR